MNNREQARSARNSARRAILATLLLASLCATAPVASQQSSRYSMERVVVSAAGGSAGSARFATTAVVAQSPVAGAASHCNQGFISGVGFWSLTSDVTVPIRLSLTIDQAAPDRVELRWTGTDDRFRLYRSPTPHDVTDPANLLAESTLCGHEETGTPGPGVQFYRVLAVAQP